MRQFVLVTSIDPLVVWFYDACYMRLAKHEYTLTGDGIEDRFAQLTNYSVQRHAAGGQGNAAGDTASTATGDDAAVSGSDGEGGDGDDEVASLEGSTCSHVEYIRMLQAQHGQREGLRLWNEQIQPAMHAA